MTVRLRSIVLGITVAASVVAINSAAAAELSPLLDAAKNGDKAKLKALVKPGAKVNVTEGDGSTALHWASYRDDLESVDLLIRAGANVNAANDLGVTPLWAACQNGSLPMVKRLLDAGANPNIKLESGETPVMIAARAGKANVVDALLNKAADPNGRGTRGQTALMWAIAEHHPDVVKSLLAHHADVNVRSEVQAQLWQTSPEQDVHPDYQAKIQMGGDTAILFAARYGDLESAKLLVEFGANVNDASAYGTSAVVLAAHSGNGELVDFLLSQKADPNADKAGYTALHAALLRGNTKAVASLLDHGANPNAKLRVSTPVRRSSADYFFHPAFIGATPFWLAARFSEPEAMKLLIAHGADPLFVHNVDYWSTRTKTSDYKRETPGATTALMAAVGLGRGSGFRPVPVAEREQRTLEAVKIAVEAGVPVSATDAEGRTALEAATAMDYKSVVSYLIEKGATLKGPVRPMKKESVEN